MKYIIGVGTNIGNRKENIERAIESINLLPYTDVLRASGVYETEPVGYARQENFYNIILEVKSQFEPNEMLGACLGIEAGFGRLRTVKNGPRIIDLDVIFAENLIVETKNFIVPHPRYFERRFVLEPLMELYPQGEVFGFEIKKHLDKIQGQDVKKIFDVKI